MKMQLPRVVVADDESHVLRMVKMTLKSMEYNVVAEASNGQEAIELFRQERPDMLFLDVNMPLKTGIEALETVMADTPEACVVMMTSVSDMESIDKCVDAGASNWIRKDTPVDEMKKLIRETWESCNADD